MVNSQAPLPSAVEEQDPSRDDLLTLLHRQSGAGGAGTSDNGALTPTGGGRSKMLAEVTRRDNALPPHDASPGTQGQAPSEPEFGNRKSFLDGSPPAHHSNQPDVASNASVTNARSEAGAPPSAFPITPPSSGNPTVGTPVEEGSGAMARESAAAAEGSSASNASDPKLAAINTKDDTATRSLLDRLRTASAKPALPGDH